MNKSFFEINSNEFRDLALAGAGIRAFAQNDKVVVAFSITYHDKDRTVFSYGLPPHIVRSVALTPGDDFVEQAMIKITKAINTVVKRLSLDTTSSDLKPMEHWFKNQVIEIKDSIKIAA